MRAAGSGFASGDGLALAEAAASRVTADIVGVSGDSLVGVIRNEIDVISYPTAL